MAKSIAELRQSPAVGRPESTYPICVAGKLKAQLQELDRKMIEAAAIESVTTDDGDQVQIEDTRPRRYGDKNPAVEYAQQADEIRDQILEHTVDLVIRAHDLGEWRDWCDQHPAREDHTRDARVTYGICNVDDLVASLEDYVVSISGEPLGPGDWDFVAANAAPADLTALARAVVDLHETAVDLGKSRRAWLATQVSGTDSR